MNWIAVLGRFHPLLVHLPIGILVLACLFEWISYSKKFEKLQESVAIALLLGAVTALGSCVTGLLLSQSGEYNATTVSWHQWLGISTTIVSFVFWWIKRKAVSAFVSRAFVVLTLILLTVTGHLGGTLTHGENYLTENLTQENATVDFNSVDLSKAMYYQDLVQPILRTRCYSCHGEAKQKGKLRLDLPEYILKGGKKGKTVVALHPDESEMINRLLLPLNEKNHMPPKEKPQPSPAEMEILKMWIALGADFSKSTHILGAEAKLQKILSSTIQQKDELDEKVSAANEEVLEKLRKYNVVIQTIADGNNHLSANLINAQPMDSATLLLAQVKDQLVWLKANSSRITDADVKNISKVTALRRLDLSQSKITDAGAVSLKDLVNLASLNLSGTSIGIESVRRLATGKSLKEFFIYHTKITDTDIRLLKKEFPSVTFEIGNYTVPTLDSDTTIVKRPK